MFVPTISRFPFIPLDGEKYYGSEVSLKNTTQWPQKGPWTRAIHTSTCSIDHSHMPGIGLELAWNWGSFGEISLKRVLKCHLHLNGFLNSHLWHARFKTFSLGSKPETSFFLSSFRYIHGYVSSNPVEGVFPYLGYIDMRGPQRVGFSAIFLIK